MSDPDIFPKSAEILDTVEDDAAVDTERLERATVGDKTAECVDFVSEVTLNVTERSERAMFPESQYEQLCRQRVPYAECYEYAPEDFSEATIEFVEMGCQPQRCGDCDGDGTTVCSSCGGRGTERCYNCGGTGTQDCSDCQGLGDVPGIDDEGPARCTTCGGSGTVTCDAFNCDGGKKDCQACYGRGRQECSLCSGEGAVVVAVHGALEFIKTRTVETEATAFETDLFELSESDGSLIERSREEPTDRIGKAGDSTTRVWRRVTEQRSIPCVSVTYDCDGETYTAGWVDGDVRRGEYPPSEMAVREQIEHAIDDHQFTYDSSPDDGATSLIVTDVITTAKTLFWISAGILAAFVALAATAWLLGSVLPGESVGSTVTGVLSLIAILGISLYIAARRHKQTTVSTPGRSVAAMTSPALASVVVVALLATGQVSLLIGGSIFGFAAILWGVAVARHLQSVAEEAAFVSDRRETFLTETLDYPPEVVNRHDLGDLLPNLQAQTERRAKRVATVVGIGCVGLASLYTTGTLVLSLLGLEDSTLMSAEPIVAVGFLSLPTALILLSGGAVLLIHR